MLLGLMISLVRHQIGASINDHGDSNSLFANTSHFVRTLKHNRLFYTEKPKG